MTNFLLAGGGTAGHVNPLLALAAAIKQDSPSSKVWALGTAEGLEAKLVPAAGVELITIERLPFPRKISGYALSFPLRFLRAIRSVENFIKANQIDVIVGFGGYASAPAYLAAKRCGVAIVVHEANALPGWANKLGAKSAEAVGVAFKSTPLPNASFVGMPLRESIEAVADYADRESARLHFGLDPDTVTLLVTGGSLGAKRINDTIVQSRKVLSAAGIQVLHIVGGRSDLEEIHEKDYVRIAYCDRMDLAIAASSFAVSRAGASTVSEFAAVGLPAVYVPYPVGNGEQRFNVADIEAAGGGLVVADADFDAAFVATQLVPLISSSKALADMSKKARQNGVADGAARLLALVKSVL